MARIRMLPESLIGKIAAGEVVERPSAAIKELVENSLDAGARNVSVEIREGGIESFRVTDDGSGIEETDIRLAFERHATSKIRSETDLDAVMTLGFRGEALASVAAVSRVTLTTRTRDRDTGIRVKNEGGRITEMTEAACAPGTSILVKELFYNVPVRRGFLKKPMTEANAVTDVMIRMILSRPDVSFRYTSDGKTIYHSPGDGKTESAVLAIYGPAAVRTLRRAEGHENGILLSGYVGIGDNARANRSGENFFINGRTLRSPLLSGALEDACRERVMIGKFPLCVLYLEMPAESVNVNIHPNKLEVRFRSDQAVREAVYNLVRDALQDRDAFERPVEMNLSESSGETEPASAFPAPQTDPIRPQRGAEVVTGGSLPPVRLRETIAVPVYRPVEGKTPPVRMDPGPASPLPPPLTEARRTAETGVSPSDAEIRNVEGTNPTPAAPAERQMDPGPLPAGGAEPLPPEEAYVQERTEQLSALPKDLPRPMRIFGALFDTFILIEYEDHLLMVDQHAVHERLLFERMMKAYEENRAGQEMLVPCILSVTRREMAVLEENRDMLEELGLRAEPFSETSVAVRSVPVTLGKNETAAFLRDAIAELESGRIPGTDKKRAAILQMACKHAVKGGEKLTEEQLRSLVEEMIDRKVTPTCPHGRPLVVSISHTELDKKFKRIQT